VIGERMNNAVARPEEVLKDYDVVFAEGLAAGERRRRASPATTSPATNASRTTEIFFGNLFIQGPRRPKLQAP